MLRSAQTNLIGLGLGKLRGCSLVGTPYGSIEGTLRLDDLNRACHRLSRLDLVMALQGVWHFLGCHREHRGKHHAPGELFVRQHSSILESRHELTDIFAMAVVAIDLEVVDPPCILYGELDRSVNCF